MMLTGQIKVNSDESPPPIILLSGGVWPVSPRAHDAVPARSFICSARPSTMSLLIARPPMGSRAGGRGTSARCGARRRSPGAAHGEPAVQQAEEIGGAVIISSGTSTARPLRSARKGRRPHHPVWVKLKELGGRLGLGRLVMLLVGRPLHLIISDDRPPRWQY